MPEKTCHCHFRSMMPDDSHIVCHAGRMHCAVCGYPMWARWRLRSHIAWYDIYIGAYWNRDRRLLYVFPLPMIGFVLNFGDNP